MPESDQPPVDAATEEGSSDKKAQRAKRDEIGKLRMNMKFLDAEIERHQETRKELRASLEALGVGGGKKKT